MREKESMGKTGKGVRKGDQGKERREALRGYSQENENLQAQAGSLWLQAKWI